MVTAFAVPFPLMGLVTVRRKSVRAFQHRDAFHQLSDHHVEAQKYHKWVVDVRIDEVQMLVDDVVDGRRMGWDCGTDEEQFLERQNHVLMYW